MSVPVLAGISAGAFVALAGEQAVGAVAARTRLSAAWKHKLIGALAAAALAIVLFVATSLAW